MIDACNSCPFVTGVYSGCDGSKIDVMQIIDDVYHDVTRCEYKIYHFLHRVNINCAIGCIMCSSETTPATIP